MADETKAYRVSLMDGTGESVVHVPLRAPFTRKIRRHFETVRDLPDGRKKLEFELREVDHPMDVESEMRADAIRVWNMGRGSAIAARNLIVEAVAEPVQSPAETVQHAPRRRQTEAAAELKA